MDENGDKQPSNTHPKTNQITRYDTWQYSRDSQNTKIHLGRIDSKESDFHSVTFCDLALGCIRDQKYEIEIQDRI